MFELLLACVLLNVSPQAQPQLEYIDAVTTSNMILVALRDDVITPNDVRNKNWHPNNLLEYTDEIRQRYINLKDAPPADDYKEFPSMVELCRQRKTISEVIDYVENQLTFYGSASQRFESSNSNDPRYNIWSEFKQEMWARYHIVAAAVDACRDPEYAWSTSVDRRFKLLALKQMLGDDRYKLRVLPQIPLSWYKYVYNQ